MYEFGSGFDVDASDLCPAEGVEGGVRPADPLHRPAVSRLGRCLVGVSWIEEFLRRGVPSVSLRSFARQCSSPACEAHQAVCEHELGRLQRALYGVGSFIGVFYGTARMPVVVVWEGRQGGPFVQERDKGTAGEGERGLQLRAVFGGPGIHSGVDSVDKSE